MATKTTSRTVADFDTEQSVRAPQELFYLVNKGSGFMTPKERLFVKCRVGSVNDADIQDCKFEEKEFHVDPTSIPTLTQTECDRLLTYLNKIRQHTIAALGHVEP